MQLPLVDPRPEELVLKREPFASYLTLFLPTGDSYKLSVHDAELYLKLLKVPSFNHVLTDLWNFGGLWVSTVTWKTQVLTRDAIRNGLEFGEPNSADFALAAVL